MTNTYTVGDRKFTDMKKARRHAIQKIADEGKKSVDITTTRNGKPVKQTVYKVKVKGKDKHVAIWLDSHRVDFINKDGTPSRQTMGREVADTMATNLLESVLIGALL